MDDDYLNREKLAKEILEKDKNTIPEFWKGKYKREAQKNWNLFYKRNTTNFFKDRHWTDREFVELIENKENGEKTILLEIGCGVGNFVWPLLDKNPNLFIHACDFSEKAVELVKENEKYDTDRCSAFVCDLTKDDLVENIEPNSVDLVSAIFVFSALPPEKMQLAVSNILKILKPGGKILFRDYGIYDAAQLRFKPGQKLQESLYVRQDGTLAYYFTIEEISNLFVNYGGFKQLESRYVIKQTTNVKRDLNVERVFLQAKFELPLNHQ
ncbi:hypothetical protein BB559_000935 [Furculomyces boomerangus]|uniref:tRNA N(3)-methylcytidine methyltransferase n=2 Tax=Harpellales TaxID=61421 RepID=A0A2T9Z3M8_9FUNG|nr:hypothetical protein BB559_000935 [Furculomyces boomerangus]PWA00339.1 hypothetical protein BB558_003614 [Smittium angustum]